VTKQAADETLKAVERRAMEVAAMPPNDREARYAEIHKIYKDSALQLVSSEDSAVELAAKMVEFTRVMVGLIETGGDATGGQS